MTIIVFDSFKNDTYKETARGGLALTVVEC
jgi:hypothetical protein